MTLAIPQQFDFVGSIICRKDSFSTISIANNDINPKNFGEHQLWIVITPMFLGNWNLTNPAPSRFNNAALKSHPKFTEFVDPHLIYGANH